MMKPFVLEYAGSFFSVFCITKYLLRKVDDIFADYLQLSDLHEMKYRKWKDGCYELVSSLKRSRIASAQLHGKSDKYDLLITIFPPNFQNETFGYWHAIADFTGEYQAIRLNKTKGK